MTHSTSTGSKEHEYMTDTSDPGRDPSAASAADGHASMRDRGLNPNWLEDHQAHQARVRDAACSTITQPRPEVVEVLAAVARGEHDDRVEQLVGNMLDTTPRRLFARFPDVRDLVHRAVAEFLVDPGSPSCEEAMDHLEARTRLTGGGGQHG